MVASPELEIYDLGEFKVSGNAEWNWTIKKKGKPALRAALAKLSQDGWRAYDKSRR
jgi:hypothetical protein